MLRSKNRFSHILLILLAGFNLIACGNDDPTLDLLGPEPDIGRCYGDPYQGASLNLSATVDDAFTETNYFKKILRLSQLDGLLQVSSLAIANHLQRRGVSLFRVIENNNSQCRYFAFLRQADVERQKIWQSFSESQGELALLGLFRTYFYRHPQTGQVELISPLIMVRQDTDKWTLIHEMTHFLFAEARASVRNMPYTEELYGELDDAADELETLELSYKKNPRTATAFKIIAQFNKFYKTNMEIFRRDALEEFTIEAMLVDRVREGLITQIDEDLNLKNAYSYMLSSAMMVTPSLEKIIVKSSYYRNRLFSTEESGVKKPLRTIEQDIRRHLKFIDGKLKSLEEERGTTGFSLPMSAFSPHLQMMSLGRHGHHIDLEGLERQKEIIDRL